MWGITLSSAGRPNNNKRGKRQQSQPSSNKKNKLAALESVGE
jgi:hypothetical protein